MRWPSPSCVEKFDFRLVLICALLRLLNASLEPDVSGYRKFPENGDRRVLYCPIDECKSDECCSCRALPCWKIDECGQTIGQLSVEYINRYTSVIVVPPKYKNSSVHSLIHPRGRLKDVPNNICEFAETLVELNLTNNGLKNISKLTCLKNLDTLVLDYNKITKISNETFSEMKHLRVLSLSKMASSSAPINLVPDTFKIPGGNIFHIDVTNNYFQKVDVTNIIRKGSFCKIDYSGSEIVSQTNAGNYDITSLSPGEKHGPGEIRLTSTIGHSFINWSSFGLHDYKDFPKYVAGDFRWDNSSIICDCNIVPLIRDLGEGLFEYWPDIAKDFICETPELMRGKNLTSIVRGSSRALDALVCDIGPCPNKCTCTDVQNRPSVVVKCTGVTKFPDFVPVGFWDNSNIELVFENSSVTELEDKSYLDRIKVLNLEGNPVSTINPAAAEKLTSATIDLSGHTLRTLPENLRKLKPDKLYFGDKPVPCDCSNLWIGEWIDAGSSDPQNYSLKCQIDQITVKPIQVTADFLHCPKTETDFRLPVGLLASALFLIIVVSLVSYYFRYEIFLLKQRITFSREKNLSMPGDYDLYVSSVDSREMNTWVREYLRLPLQEIGYSSFFGSFDILPGNDRHDGASDAIQRSRNYVVVLSENYAEDDSTLHELHSIWKHFSSSKNKQMIVINFDHFECSEIQDPRLRAVRRLNFDLNFADRETKMLDRLCKTLGRPVCRNVNFSTEVGHMLNEQRPLSSRQRNRTLPSNFEKTKRSGNNLNFV